MLRPGQSVVLCVIALLTIGVIMVNSAGMSIDPKHAVTFGSILLSRSTVYMALALVALGAVAYLPVRRLAEIAAPPSHPSGSSAPGTLTQTLLSLRPMWFAVLAIVALLLTVYLPVIGREVNGSARWIALPIGGRAADPAAGGGLSMQPSELAKWGLVLVIAWYGATRAHLLPRFRDGLLPALAAVLVIAGLIIKEDLGTGALAAMVAVVMLIAAGARVWHFAAMAPLGVAAVAGAIIVNPYRVDRILAFLDPYADPEGTGYHMIQSMVSVVNGEVFGRGLGFGLQKFGYLPEDRTDFLFAVICEELGLMGATIVIALYAGLLWSGLAIIRREPNIMLKLAALGVVTTVGLQAVINLAVVTGMGPTKGIALPLLSSGGTGWILTAASLGLLVAIDRTQQRHASPVGAPRDADGSGEGSRGRAAPVIITTAARAWPSLSRRAS